MRRPLKPALVRVGSRLSPHKLHLLDAALNYVATGHWLREHGFTGGLRVRRRVDVFDAILADVRDDDVLYIELGVFRGDSMRYWSQALTSERSRLHGFDSFEGLPEGWSLREGRGHFSTGGEVPQIPDARVEFFRGWFDDTLPSYVPPPHRRAVINFDADLYSSTDVALRALEPLIRDGTYVYFDEFQNRHHEQRAFTEFLERTRKRFALVAATPDFTHVAFRCLGE